ncbi:unnamed protein product [Rotaria socialis]
MKRSYSFLNSNSKKRSKTIDDSTKKSSLTLNSLQFFLVESKNLFIDYLHMSPIIFKHQLYSLASNNCTLLDRIMLMFTNDYQLLVEQQLNENNLSSLSIEKNRLKQRLTQDLLPNNKRLSIDKNSLENGFDLNTNDIHLLIQLGLLLPKQIDQYWFSIPNLAQFVACIEKGRRTLIQILSRRTYREIPMNEFRLRDTKKQCLLGFDYHIHDLIGANLAHVIDAPTGPIVKMGPEKFII